MTRTNPASPAECRSVLQHDRPCLSCGYNLIGSVVTQDADTAIFIVRCDCCEHVQAAQTQPVVPNWSNRLRTLLAGIYAILIAAALASSTFILFMSFVTTLADMMWQLRYDLGNISDRWPNASASELWVLAGGIRGLADAELLMALGFFMLVFGSMLGFFWSVVLVHRGIGSIATLLLVQLTIAVLLAWLALTHMFGLDLLSTDAAAGLMRLFIVYCTIPMCVVFAAFAIFGTVIGRPVARALVRILLPPRFQHAFRIWSNVPPPAMTGVRRIPA